MFSYSRFVCKFETTSARGFKFKPIKFDFLRLRKFYAVLRFE
ncbi:hypothetical protein CAMGR0001_0796 [Campylobacter gracilis RM3268]|uniref:Uncharacterized protein n=1 Tax=Campylobacter gracilis RM3268 TaxID=553220 RepID=C8PG03_9BACT|nr:hypothetical protein CAMGR0001_0796 [Campylobacter gracilis RM3268]